MRRRVAALVAASAVVIAAFAIILAVGVIPPPELPSLQDSPDPSIPGTVAFVTELRGEGCVRAVAASGGQPHDVYCVSQRLGLGEPVAFTPDGHLVVTSSERSGGEILIIALEGTVVERIPLDEVRRSAAPGRFVAERQVRADGARLMVDSLDEGVAAVSVRHEGDVTELYRARGPRNYMLVDAQWSPDGQWVMLTDSEGRLAVMGGDGEPRPRMLAGDASGAAWHIPGNPTYTTDPRHDAES